MVDGVSIGEIILIERKRVDGPSFMAGLIKKGYSVTLMANGSAAIQQLSNGLPDVVILNAASMRTSGTRICQSIHRQEPELPVILVVEEEPDDPDRVDADLILVLPFTLQKLVNRIKIFMPPQNPNILKVGAMKLDLENNILRFKHRSANLTPRMTLLLKKMMENNGQVLKREELFTEVWNTDYIEDMRTLDVHISWLRQAIEKKPRKPKYLKTVRGVGYMLKIPKKK
jgi:DNA-binding response OmpR family regulator